MPSDKDLLAANPDGGLITSGESFDIQISGRIPSFLYGTQDQVAYGVSKAGESRPDGARIAIRWGLWHYFIMEGKELGSRDTWTKLVQRGSFENGRRVGHWTFWYPDGKKRGEGTFEDNQMSGEWKVWLPDGQPDEENRGRYSKGQKVE